MKQASPALRVTGVTVVTAGLGYPRPCHPSGEHPINAACRRGLPPPLSARKATPAVRKTSPGFSDLRLQGVTHYTLQARQCARRSLWTPFLQGLRPASPPPAAAEKAVTVTVPCSFRGYPKSTVITVTTVTLSPPKEHPPKKERRSGDYALRDPAFSETQGRLRGCL